MPFEDELGDALRRTGAGFRADDQQGLLAGGVQRGRRRVARRRTVAVTGSVLALAVVGVGGAYGGGLLGNESGGQQDSVAAAPKPVGEGKDKAKVTAKDMIKTLTGLLPKGTLTVETARGTEDKMPMVSGVFDDGKGKAAIGISFFRTSPGDQGFSECPDKNLVPNDGCTAETLADGSRLVILQGYEYPDKREETKSWRATLLTKDGILVDASEYNAPAPKGAGISRTDPPLTPAQLKTLVTAEQWKPVVAGVPAPDKTKADGAKAGAKAGAPTPAGPEPSTIDGKAVHATLVSLLPKGLRVTDKGAEGDEHAYVVVDDGRGESLVGINVQPNMKDVEAELFPAGTYTTLPDGTKVRAIQQPGEKGGKGVVWWSVDTIRPDGRRVVISAFNAPAQHLAATRDEPAPTMEQLKSIATSEKWRTLK
ncbi:hypothetical protein [Streptomyces sp. NPDC059909]|uniref:hypothetical protein n=1 Tax=Streptomyces sp. NPDC059909 TaxID=3346998 RepID=UPI00365BD0A5